MALTQQSESTKVYSKCHHSHQNIKRIYLKSRNKARMFITMLLFNTVLVVLTSAIGQENNKIKILDNIIDKEKVKRYRIQIIKLH